MITRIVTLMLIAVLALPVATLTRPAETHQSPWGDVSVAAKGKKHKGKRKRPKAGTDTRTVRQVVTQSFANTQPITIPDGAPTTRQGKAAPYPSAIAVSGFRNGRITDVNLILDDLSHGHHDHIDLLLSRSDGRRALVMSDAGDFVDPADIDLTLDDEATAPLPDNLRSGTFQPGNFDVEVDTFDAPAPTPDGNVALSTFDGADPNGTWQLWVMDNGANYSGDIGGGWVLQITAEVDVQAPDQAPIKKHQKKGKGRR
jgi:hypothetical protein